MTHASPVEHDFSDHHDIELGIVEDDGREPTTKIPPNASVQAMMPAPNANKSVLFAPASSGQSNARVLATKSPDCSTAGDGGLFSCQTLKSFRWEAYKNSDTDQAKHSTMHQLFAAALYEDESRWEQGLAFLHNLEDWSHATARRILQDGAHALGFWHMSDNALEALVDMLMGETVKPSPALSRWMSLQVQKDGTDTTESHVSLGDIRRQSEEFIMAKPVQESLPSEQIPARVTVVTKVNVFLNILILLIANLHTTFGFAQYPVALNVFGWPAYVAKMTGMACACWTAVLYITMARSFLTWLSRQLDNRMSCCSASFQTMLEILCGHKELHIMGGVALLVTSIVHTLMHVFGTMPQFLSRDVESLNSVLGCADVDVTPGYVDAPLKALRLLRCPLEQNPKTLTEMMFATTPGISGIALLAILAASSWTGRLRRRQENFDRFYLLHNVLLFTWPVMLFIHGCSGWIGAGIPVVVFTSSLPLLAVLWDRFLRLLRYCLFAGSAVRIERSVVRPSKSGGPDGAMIFLQVSTPSFLWKFRPGMYAFLCMPEYAPCQWHPFTVCSGETSDTASFLIAGAGDWTGELIKRCSMAREGMTQVPKIAIDGPYFAPAQNALSSEVLIAIGAGVGIAPFLSLVATIISRMSDEKAATHIPIKEAHIYWMTRSVDEFLFGRDLFTEINLSPHLREIVFLHLHTTVPLPEKEPAAFMFREAIKRQSKFDQGIFYQSFPSCAGVLRPSALAGSQTPWCWAYGVQSDVLWVSHLIKNETRAERTAIKNSCSTKWSEDLWQDNVKDDVMATDSSFIDVEDHAPIHVNRLQMSASSQNSSVCPAPTIDGAASLSPSWIRQTTATTAGTLATKYQMGSTRYMLPISFSRPDFNVELRAIAATRPTTDVNVYVCGNSGLLESLRNICDDCNANPAGAGKHRQRMTVHHERFE